MFEICLGALLTQNTSWSNVEKVLSGLKQQRYLEFNRLLRLPRKKLERTIRSSGYFRQKAERVSLFLKTVKQRSGSFKNFFAGELSELREKLLNLQGVGPETADSMLLYAAGKPIFVVDAYTRRIGTRWGVLRGNESYEQIQSTFTEALPRSPQIFGEFHALLVKLAKDICRPQPLCTECPLFKVCKTGLAV
jgi:endonuclease-3 related protein